jgi:DNA-binding response OmpR family regulator
VAGAAAKDDDIVHVLVVDDEPQMQFLLADNLDYEGYKVTAVGTAEAALEAVQRETFSIVLLDIMLPGMNGFQLCRQLRTAHPRLPIIVLTARNEEADRVRGLNLGADDYVGKPFSIQELLARIRARLRRESSEEHDPNLAIIGDVVVNLRTHVVTRRGERLILSTRELDLLEYLIAHRGQVVTRDQLLRDVWGYQPVALTRTVDNFVAKLRMLIEAAPHEPQFLVTVHGTGYRLLE